MRKIFLIFVCLQFQVASAAPSPNRFFDGEMLAAHVGHWALENLTYEQRQQRTSAKWITFSLYRGEEIGDFSSYQPMLAWMLAQPDGSIRPDAFYEKAIELMQGNIESAMVLAWDVLRTDWNARGVERNNFQHIRKLFDLTGERELFNGTSVTIVSPKGREIQALVARGDNFSAWYHFSGTALHSFLHMRRGFKLLPTNIKTKLMILLEEYVFHSQYIDPKKRRDIDFAGAAFGYKLAKYLHKYTTAADLAADPQIASQLRSDYIYDNPERYGEGWALRPGETPQDYAKRYPPSCLRLTIASYGTTPYFFGANALVGLGFVGFSIWFGSEGKDNSLDYTVGWEERLWEKYKVHNRYLLQILAAEEPEAFRLRAYSIFLDNDQDASNITDPTSVILTNTTDEMAHKLFIKTLQAMAMKKIPQATIEKKLQQLVR